MQHTLSYRNEEIVLRPLTLTDTEPLRLLRNREENRRWYFNDAEIDSESQQKWYRRYLSSENDYMFAVGLANDPMRFVGAAAFYDYNADENCFEIGRLLLDSKQMPRKHMSVDVIAGIVDIVSTHFPGASLKAEVFADNARSLNALVSNGFEVTDETCINGKAVKVLIRRTGR